MRTLFTMLLALGFVAAMTGSAMAQDGDGEPRTKFYDFDDMLIDGQFQNPEVMTEKAREKAKFNRLSGLKKSFLPKVQETTKESALQ